MEMDAHNERIFAKRRAQAINGLCAMRAVNVRWRNHHDVPAMLKAEETARRQMEEAEAIMRQLGLR